MDVSEAIEILRKHNRWRVGADIPMVHPKTLTEAIDTIVKDYNEKKDYGNKVE